MPIFFVDSFVLSGGGIPPLPYDPDAPNLGCAKIGYQNLFAGASTDPVDAVKMLTYDTWQRYRPTGIGEVVLTIGQAQTIDYIALGASIYQGVPLTIQVRAGGLDWSTVYTGTPENNRAIMIVIDGGVIVDSIRILHSESCELGVLFAGQYLQMQRPLFGGHSPIVLSARTEYNNSVSDSGQWLGRSITRRGVESDYSWQLLTDTWVREKFMPFVEHAKTKPFFMAWRPDLYPDEVVYGWCNEDITPSNRGGGTRFMNVSMSVIGHDDR